MQQRQLEGNIEKHNFDECSADYMAIVEGEVGGASLRFNFACLDLEILDGGRPSERWHTDAAI